MREFVREDIEFYIKKSFKGLSKEYMLDTIFNENIQNKWSPEVGDIIVGCTGNIFVISSKDMLHETLGGVRFYFGGGMCNRDGGNTLDESYSSTMNESGKWIGWRDGKLQEYTNCYHSSWKDFRFVPYPHEKERI